MLRLASDEDFHGRLLRGMLRREPTLDVIRAQDHGLGGHHDREVLEWAAAEGRILLTHDRTTIPTFAYERLGRGDRMPGVFVFNRRAALAQLIDEVLLLATCSEMDEWENLVIHIPL